MNEEKLPFLSGTFPGQKDGEHIRYIIKKHWTVMARVILIAIVFSLPGLIVYFLSGNVLAGLGSNIHKLILFLATIWLWAAAFKGFTSWLNEFIDVIVITNERIIDITQTNLFHRDIAETSLDKVEDATGSIKGVLGTLFKFGSISIQTAAAEGKFGMELVDKPYLAARTILDAQEAFLTRERKEAEGQASARQEELAKEITEEVGHQEELREVVKEVIQIEEPKKETPRVIDLRRKDD